MRELRPDVGAEEFSAAIQKAKAANRFGASVYVYPVEDYRNMRLFLSEDGTSGVAIKPDGDIVSLFNSSDGPNKGVAYSLLQLALENGGRKMDNFDTVLTKLYEDMGFKEVKREQWNPDMMPPDWDKETFRAWNNGEPDIVYMEYPEPAKKAKGRRGKK